MCLSGLQCYADPASGQFIDSILYKADCSQNPDNKWSSPYFAQGGLIGARFVCIKVLIFNNESSITLDS